MMRQAILVLSILVLTAFLFQARIDRAWGSASVSDAAPGEVVTEGKISVVDGDKGQPTAQLIQKDGKAFLLIGPHGEVLKGLRFGELKVWGKPDKPILNMNTLVVERFEILAIDGQKPLFGRLVAKDGKAYLQAEGSPDMIELSATPNQTDTLLTGNGRWAWVIGERTGDVVAVQKFKVL